jgi:hypothetical protein
MPFSGYYMITTAAIVACQCRVGSCSGINFSPGGVNSVTETDGAIQIKAPSGGVCSGGVNSDGTFSCNGGQAGSVGYVLESGQFQSANCMPTSMDGQILNTFSNGLYDCDVQATFTAQYFGRATAFAAMTPAGISVTGPSVGGTPQTLGLFGLVGSQ